MIDTHKQHLKLKKLELLCCGIERLKTKADRLRQEIDKEIDSSLNNNSYCGIVLARGKEYKAAWGIDDELRCGDTYKGILYSCNKCTTLNRKLEKK